MAGLALPNDPGRPLFCSSQPQSPYPEPPTSATLPLQQLTGGPLPSLGSGEISNQHIPDTNPLPTPLPPPQDWRAALGLTVFCRLRSTRSLEATLRWPGRPEPLLRPCRPPRCTWVCRRGNHGWPVSAAGFCWGSQRCPGRLPTHLPGIQSPDRRGRGAVFYSGHCVWVFFSLNSSLLPDVITHT